MNRVCLIVHDLRPPADPAAPALVRHAWALVRALRREPAETILLQTGPATTEARAALHYAAREVGATYRHLEEFPLPFTAPIMPAVPAHRTGWHVAHALGALDVSTALFVGDVAHAATALAARRAASALTGCRIVLALDAPAEFRRQQAGQFPTEGRIDIATDFLERQAIARADGVAVVSEPVLAWLRAAGWTLPADVTVEPLIQENDDAAVRAFCRSLLAGDVPPESRVNSLLQQPSASSPLPRVSVCVPFYEQPALLGDALALLATQSLPPHEVIVVDDGSKSPEAIAAFAEAARRFARPGWKFLRQENAGPAAARNRAAREATGDALLCCDADNRFRPEMVATLARALAQTGADAVACAFQSFRAPDDPQQGDPGYVFAPLGACLELGLIENVLADTNTLVRREVFLDLGGFPERIIDEDWQFFLQLIRRPYRLEVVPAVLFDYRLAPVSRARSQSELASATGVVAPVLAAADPAWRRLWPHAAGLVRNPRLGRLECAIEEARARTSEARDRTAAAQALVRRRQWEIVLQRLVLERERTQRAQSDADLTRRLTGQTQRAAGLEQRVAGLESALRQSDDKVRRMQASASWQITAPLRALRRATLDRAKSPPLAPGQPPPPRVLWSVDLPSDWEAAPAIGAITGWALLEDGAPAGDIRATIDGAAQSVRGGLRREDVAAAHGFAAPASSACGFQIAYRLEADRAYAVVLEAQVPDGRWVRIHDRKLQTSRQPRAVRDYAAWVEAFGRLTPEKATALRTRLAALPAEKRPLLSVLMPVYNPPERWLRRAVDSVREQVYDSWELCLADDASTEPHVRPLLERYAAEDPRIRVVFRAENGHISHASNSALELARGEFVALLDHDDELAPDALAEVALLLASQPDADLIYTDEDKIDEDGRRYTPYFKPDYLPDLLTGQNCLSHLSVYRTALVRAVGGFRPGYEGSQDWDLALRVIDRTTPDRVRHIPKVLYHWRAISGSTAREVSEKDYSLDAARRALLDHFARRGIVVEVRPVRGNHWQIVYPLPTQPPLVSIIIPTHNAAALLRTCVASIFARTDYAPYEIVIVNNRSDDPATLALFGELTQEPNVHVIDYDAPFNFSAINNFAVRQARGDVLCLLNNDIEVITGRWLEEMVSHALRPEIGAVGAMLYYPNLTVQHAGAVLGLGGVANHAFLNHAHGTEGYMNRARLTQNYSAVTGACLAIRRAVFEQVGGFNETDLPIAFNDIDFCLRVHAAGYRNLWTPFAEFFHHESASRGKEDTPEKQARFANEVAYMRRTWGPMLDHDPAYNLNLALNVEGWDLAWPPRE
jgi:glycosyltransferase involved in cell wall biosynthesis